MLVFQTIWRNKNEHKTQKTEEGREGVRFQDFKKFTDERLCWTPSVPILTVFTLWLKMKSYSDFQTRCLVYVTEQPSSVGVVRISLFEKSVVVPKYTMSFSKDLEKWNLKLDFSSVAGFWRREKDERIFFQLF